MTISSEDNSLKNEQLPLFSECMYVICNLLNHQDEEHMFRDLINDKAVIELLNETLRICTNRDRLLLLCLESVERSLNYNLFRTFDDENWGEDIDIKNHFDHIGLENNLTELMGYNNEEICKKAIHIMQNYIEEADDDIENLIEQKATNEGHLYDDRKENQKFKI